MADSAGFLLGMAPIVKHLLWNKVKEGTQFTNEAYIIFKGSYTHAQLVACKILRYNLLNLLYVPSKLHRTSKAPRSTSFLSKEMN